MVRWVVVARGAYWIGCRPRQRGQLFMRALASLLQGSLIRLSCNCSGKTDCGPPAASADFFRIARGRRIVGSGSVQARACYVLSTQHDHRGLSRGCLRGGSNIGLQQRDQRGLFSWRYLLRPAGSWYVTIRLERGKRLAASFQMLFH
jgi:hypothetical protein